MSNIDRKTGDIDYLDSYEFRSQIINGVRYVGENAFPTIQQAVDDIGDQAGPGAVVVTSNYKPYKETWPVKLRSEHIGTVIQSSHSDEIDIDTGGAGAFDIELGNQRPPGVYLRNLTLTDTGHGVADTVDMRDTKYSILSNITVDHNSVTGAGAAFHLVNASGSTPNSNTFTDCVGEQLGGDGFHIEPGSHSTLLRDCRIMKAAGHGVYLDGNSHQIAIHGGQLEKCDLPGLRVATASNVEVSGVYFEGNGAGSNITGTQQSEIKLQNSADNINITNCWFNGIDTSQVRLLSVNTSGAVSVDHIRYNDEYDNVFQTFDGTLRFDPQTVVADSTGSPTLFLIGAGTKRIYANGVLVGAGSNNGGTDTVNGVDLGVVAPTQAGDQAMADGTTATAQGLTATGVDKGGTTGLVWQPSDGGASI